MVAKSERYKHVTCISIALRRKERVDMVERPNWKIGVLLVIPREFRV